ncbi:hypothetical protein [Yersinia pseudotuberculosis]|uniref:hypothetical protein n=1 Tax=Yersinia pseudotuberculosis TaxID=633 RepID=UPI001E3BA112|nr:hypothetical protein [Yersinia pseudotuberculosis]
MLSALAIGVNGNQASIVTNNNGFNIIGFNIVGLKIPVFNISYPYSALLARCHLKQCIDD